MIKYYDAEALSNRVRYTIRGTYLFNSNGKIVFCCYDAEVLQQYLVGVEIVGVENRG